MAWQHASRFDRYPKLLCKCFRPQLVQMFVAQEADSANLLLGITLILHYSSHVQSAISLKDTSAGAVLSVSLKYAFSVIDPGEVSPIGHNMLPGDCFTTPERAFKRRPVEAAHDQCIATGDRP